MSKKKLKEKITIEFPEGLSVDEKRTGGGGLRAAAAERETDDSDLGRILGAIGESDELEEVTQVEIGGKLSKSRLGALEKSDDPTKAGMIVLRVPVEKEESAVLLTEQDGFLQWEFSTGEESKKRGGMGAAGSEERYLVFESRFEPVVEDRSGENLAGDITDFVLKPIKKVVFRFTARKAAEALSEYLERNIREGPVVYSKDDSGKIVWGPAADYSSVWEADAAATRRLLLLIHGTFSSTDGSYGGLGNTEAGVSFLQNALEQYDGVVAYDHKTLTKRVGQNAEDVLQALRTLPTAAKVTVDALAFSRGGLVTRYLTEVLLPSAGLPFNLEKAVFVGCTNGGTLLADPGNWKDLVRLYTNLVSAAGRLAGLLGGPQLATGAKIVSGAMRGVLTFVRYLATESLEQDAIPGLASMMPDGDDVRLINARQDGQPEPGNSAYYVIAANFNHSLFGEDKLEGIGLKKRLFFELGDGFIDKLFKNVPNDLVVDQPSMSRIDPWDDDWVEGSHEFKENDGVYHTVYFDQELVARKLTDWLL